MKKNIISSVMFTTKNFFYALLPLFMFCSCNDEDVDIDYLIVCSPDLLEFVTPVVICDGKTYTLEDYDWNKDGTVTTSSNGVSVSVTVPSYVWQKRVSYGSFGVSSSAELTFKVKDNITVEAEHPYNFYHDIRAVVVAKKDGLFKHSQSSEVGTPTQVEDLCIGEEVNDYLRKIEGKTYRRVVEVDGDGNIKSYKQ